MANYAISDGHKIINVIIADSKESAEFVTGMEAFETEGQPWIGWTLEKDGWRPPSPYSSWIWSENEWKAPIDMPEDGVNIYSWNEGSGNWEVIGQDS